MLKGGVWKVLHNMSLTDFRIYYKSHLCDSLSSCSARLCRRKVRFFSWNFDMSWDEDCTAVLVFHQVLVGVKHSSLSRLSAFDMLQARGLDLGAYHLS